MAVIRLRLDGRDHRVDVPPGEPLPSVPRTELDLTGAKYGCRQIAGGEIQGIGGGERHRSLPLAPSTGRA